MGDLDEGLGYTDTNICQSEKMQTYNSPLTNYKSNLKRKNNYKHILKLKIYMLEYLEGSILMLVIYIKIYQRNKMA